jgi:hypothetical protein
MIRDTLSDFRAIINGAGTGTGSRSLEDGLADRRVECADRREAAGGAIGVKLAAAFSSN